MEKKVIPYMTPNQFYAEYLDSAAKPLLSRAAHDPEGKYPSKEIFSIMKIEEFSKFIKFPIMPARSTVYEFFWMKKGEMVRTDILQKYIVGQGNVCFCKEGIIKSIDSCTADAEGYFVIFDKEFVLHFLKNQNSLDDLPYFQDEGSPVVKLNQDSNQEVGGLLDKIYNEQQVNLPDRQQYIGILLCQFLIMMRRESGSTVNKRNHSAAEIITLRFIKRLKQDVLKHKSVLHYANALNVTANHLNKCVKESTGKPVTTHISEMIVLEAKVMLKQGDANISEIAIRLGFENISYFTRHFRKHTGYTPTHFRDKFILQVVT